MNESIVFKEWLPDLPDLDNPGLTEALNCIPRNGTYEPIYSVNTAGSGASTLNGINLGTYVRFLSNTGYSPNVLVYAGTESKLYQSGVDKSGTAYSATASSWKFADYDEIVLATNGVDYLQWMTSGAAAFAAVTAAPKAKCIGIINQTIMLGDLNGTDRHKVQWSSIDSPLDYPTPGSSTAIARQAGEQAMPRSYGPVTGISGGDQYGIVFQDRGISRVIYIGGGAVFQFDDIDAGRGCPYPNSIVRVGGLVYFISADGFYVTDGVTVRSIGQGKVDRYFLSIVNDNYRERAWGALDQQAGCIYWGFPRQVSVSGTPDHLMIYNYEEDRWAHANLDHESLASFGPVSAMDNKTAVMFWVANYSYRFFKGLPQSSVFTTGEKRSPAGTDFIRISGVRPIFNSATSVTVAIGSRNDLNSTPTYTSEVTANSRSGYADFRQEGRYQRIRFTTTLAGTYGSAQGADVVFEVSGKV